jgi:glycosyltransferase involved in cell wall biosynthesis
MIIAEINTVQYGSTGRIMLDIADAARKRGHTVYTYSARLFKRSGKLRFPEISGHTYYGNVASSFLHKAAGQITGFNGLFSAIATKRLVKRMTAQKVEAVHLHNLHEFCINLPVLFKYIKKNNIKVFWTLHDCWSFTGHCPHFDAIGCDKWRTGCGSCPQKSVYPRTILDTTRFMWKVKKKCFTGIRDMTIITPSEWLAGLVRKSFLGCYPVKVINNGINTSVWTPSESDFRTVHGIQGKMILGVAMGWGHLKGLDVFVELARRLPRDEYTVVLVGTDDATEKQLPEGVISIRRTESIKELAEIYTAADLFVNPTRQDTYPTVNLEAIACGTPVLTFRTGGSPEMINDKMGRVVERDDIEALISEIELMTGSDAPLFDRDVLVKEAEAYDASLRFNQYVDLYEQ